MFVHRDWGGAPEASRELGLQEDPSSELCVLLHLLLQPDHRDQLRDCSAPSSLGMPVVSQPHLFLSLSAWKSISPSAASHHGAWMCWEGV